MRINDICVALVERGHTVTVVTSIPNYPEGKFFSGYGFFKNRKEVYKGISIIHIPVIPRGKNFFSLSLNYISFVISGWFFAHFSSIKPDIVFMNMSSPMTQSLVGKWFAKRRHIPSIIYILDLWPESFQAITGISSSIIIKPLERMVDNIYSSVDKVLTSSNSFVESIMTRGVPSEKLHFWPQYAEDFYRPVRGEKEGSSVSLPNDDRLKIIFTGNIGLAQGLDLLVGVAETLHLENLPVCFIIVGDGSFKSEFIEMVKNKNLTDYFLFINRQPAVDIPYLLSQSDAGLVILKKSEIFSKTIPAKVQSYMACALPLIVSADGEIQKLVETAKAGICADAENSDSLVHAIKQFLRLEKEKRVEMGNFAKMYSERTFGKENLIDQLELLLENLVKDRIHV